ncbi:MAG: AMP-binding protein, partial [Cyanophyceae cyanobacterium]
MSDITIESILHENRHFLPSPDFAQQARIPNWETYQQLCQEAERDPEGFWGRLAQHELEWFQPWDSVLQWDPPQVQWFVNGQLNISHNCLDRHLATKGDKPALIWAGEPGDRRVLTYRELHREVCQMANALKQLGVQKGDRVGIYMPMIPEAVMAMLACARIGAAHTVVFGGFSAEALKDRLRD